MSIPSCPRVFPTVNEEIFALRLNRGSTLTALGVEGEGYYERLLLREIDWLTCLINSADERVTYDLRLFCAPHPKLYIQGQIGLALLCRIENASAEEARGRAEELLRLCEAFFEDEYEFELVAREEELQQLRRPFVIGDVAEIIRRTEHTALDTLWTFPPKAPMGFGNHSASASSNDHWVYYVYPYTLVQVPDPRLMKLLLMQDEPMAVSIRLRPTALKTEEAEFLEDQITKCERYAQISLERTAPEVHNIRPTLQEQSRAYLRRFTKALLTLRDNAALMRVEVASPRRIPQSVLDALGAQITEPVGRVEEKSDIEMFLKGGYQVIHPPASEIPQHAKAFESLSLETPLDPLASDTAGRLRYLFDARESVTAFRLPAPMLEETPGLPLKTFRTQLPPASLPEEGQLLGQNRHWGHSREVRITRDDQRRHIYTVGQTGTGKTTLIESMILSNLRAGEGLCVIDPHGDLYEKLVMKIPAGRVDDVVLFDPSDSEFPVGINLLEYETQAQKYFLVQEIVAILERLIEDKYGSGATTGPVFYQYVRMGLLLVMNDPEDIGTIVQFHHLFNTEGFYKRFLPLKDPDPVLSQFLEETLERVDLTRPGSDNLSMGTYVSSKFDDFLSDPMLRNIFGQKRSTIHLGRLMDEGKVLLVNLSKGRLGEVNSRFLGMLLIAKLQAAAMARASVPVSQRRDFYLYVDEFHNLATLNFGALLSEARKFRLNLVLANQFVSQVDTRIISAIHGNVGTTISFRVGAADAELLERDFKPVFNQHDLMNLPNFYCYVSTLIDGQVSKPFSMETVRDETHPSMETAAKVREASRRTYARRREEVLQEMGESLCMEKKKLREPRMKDLSDLFESSEHSAE